MTSPRKSPKSPSVVTVQPSSPRFPIPSPTSPRKIGIAVDLSDESAYAVQWSVQNYLRPGDSVTLLHVQPTNILYGADWGATELQDSADPESFDVFTNKKASDVAQPLVEGGVEFKIHIVKDHDMKERLCLEVERLGLSTLIMGSRGFGTHASGGKRKGRLGSVSDYSVRHCACPVVVVRFGDGDDGESGGEDKLGTVPEVVEEEGAGGDKDEYHDAQEDKQ